MKESWKEILKQSPKELLEESRMHAWVQLLDFPEILSESSTKLLKTFQKKLIGRFSNGIPGRFPELIKKYRKKSLEDLEGILKDFLEESQMQPFKNLRAQKESQR